MVKPTQHTRFTLKNKMAPSLKLQLMLVMEIKLVINLLAWLRRLLINLLSWVLMLAKKVQNRIMLMQQLKLLLLMAKLH